MIETIIPPKMETKLSAAKTVPVFFALLTERRIASKRCR